MPMPGRFALSVAANAIVRGGVVAYPTEAVFGLGCDPLDADAVGRILELKRRPAGHGLIVIAADLGQLEPLLEPLTDAQRGRMLATWPGPCTWIAPSRAPAWLTGGRGTLAIRVTAHPLASALCIAADSALVSTSANLSGHQPARSALAVRRAFGSRIDYILAGPTGGLHRPTEIRDVTTGRVVRTG